jgi:hypothetical protein
MADVGGGVLWVERECLSSPIKGVGVRCHSFAKSICVRLSLQIQATEYVFGVCLHSRSRIYLLLCNASCCVCVLEPKRACFATHNNR